MLNVYKDKVRLLLRILPIVMDESALPFTEVQPSICL